MHWPELMKVSVGAVSMSSLSVMVKGVVHEARHGDLPVVEGLLVALGPVEGAGVAPVVEARPQRERRVAAQGLLLVIEVALHVGHVLDAVEHIVLGLLPQAQALAVGGGGVAGHAADGRGLHVVDAVDHVAERVGHAVVVAPVLVMAHEAVQSVDVGAQAVVEGPVHQGGVALEQLGQALGVAGLAAALVGLEVVGVVDRGGVVVPVAAARVGGALHLAAVLEGDHLGGVVGGALRLVAVDVLDAQALQVLPGLLLGGLGGGGGSLVVFGPSGAFLQAACCSASLCHSHPRCRPKGEVKGVCGGVLDVVLEGAALRGGADLLLWGRRPCGSGWFCGCGDGFGAALGWF